MDNEIILVYKKGRNLKLLNNCNCEYNLVRRIRASIPGVWTSNLLCEIFIITQYYFQNILNALILINNIIVETEQNNCKK
jgi:hypothetical protein